MERSSIFLFLSITVRLLHLSQSFVQLYNTEDSSSLEFYDCIHYKKDSNVRYCRRPEKTIELNRRHQACFPSSEQITYADLQRLNVSPSEILQWSSSVEKADQYAAYLFNNLSFHDDIETTFLCNCSKPSIFGTLCEYELFFDIHSFHHTIITQFHMKSEDIFGSQMYGNILCYTTLICNYGLLCLDWRDICNGAQNCMDGKDEENCDLLEFNECEEDEYRCANGQCIPDKYWMDGWLESSRECMDLTDEGFLDTGSDCLMELNSFDCDERVCPPAAWSCGDGQCISSLQRFSFQIYQDGLEQCFSLRDCNFVCETCNHEHLWTLETGLCWPVFREEYSELEHAVTRTDGLELLGVKCWLVAINEETKCNCLLDELCSFTNDYDYDELVELFSDPIRYPPYGLYRPFLLTYYTLDNIFFEEEMPTIYTINGSIKCRGYQGVTLNEEIELDLKTYNDIDPFIDLFPYHSRYPSGFEYLFCMNDDIYQSKSNDAPKFDELCWSETTKAFSINKTYSFQNACPTEPHCLSSYRINDGYENCYQALDEDQPNYSESCTNIRKYRLQCSLNEQPTCLLPEFVGMTLAKCFNLYDETIFGSNIPIEGFTCFKQNDNQCHLFRNYIELTTKNYTKETIDLLIQSLKDRSFSSVLSYYRYCDSFWDLSTALDESSEYCQQWTCSKNQFQCPRTKQCIDPDWICDGSWDCSDGSDEEGIFIIDQLSPHNIDVANLTELKQKCRKLYEVRPLSMLCNYTEEYPCLRNVENLEDLWNFTLHKPCIPLSQLGDGITHCYGARDEKSTIKIGTSSDMLGNAFLCKNSNITIEYKHLCGTTLSCPDFENIYGCLMDRTLIPTLAASTACGYHLSDVFCLNGRCKAKARCNHRFDCEYGEDEYMCYLDIETVATSAVDNLSYRFDKRIAADGIKTLKISNFPSSCDFVPENENTIIERTTQENFISQNLKDGSFENLQIAYYCNRGVAIHALENNNISCFCPPSYYGEHCEYYSDRLTIVTHLNYTNSPYLNKDSVVLQVLTLFLFEDKVIDHYNFRIRPVDEIETYMKHKFFLLYSRSEKYLNHKQKRYFNRTDIINNQPYSVRFEVYELMVDQTIRLIGLWQFHIYFDYLPSSRLVKVLSFPINNTINNPCQSNPCNQRSICQRILNENSPSAYVCLCQSPFYGKECEFIDGSCSDFCAPHSICKPTYNGILTSNQQPLCLCPSNYYGPRCYLKYTTCDLQPCKNNGRCIVEFDPAAIISYRCKCAANFYGKNCEYELIPVLIQIKLSASSNSSPAAVLASVVQYFDLEPKKLDLYLKHQQLSSDLRLRWQYNHDHSTAPTFAFSKVYDSNYRLTGPLLYLLYIQQNKTIINVTVELNQVNYCAHVSTLINKTNDSIPLFFKYHKLCREKMNHTGAKCFHDDDYLCICEEDHYRAECFGYDHSLDQCDYCLSLGRCVRGDRNNRVDFKCLCPRCHDGKICQFSNELLSLTLDSLIINDILYRQKLVSAIYITVAALAFLVGFFNNLCSFLTFIRPKPRKFGVGNYLLIVSILNQCSLLFLLLKVIHIILYSNGMLFNYSDINLYSCKIISFLLSAATRINYWLTSLVTIERLCLVFTLTKLKNPKVSLLISLLIMLSVVGMHIHEIFYYTTIVDPSYTSTNVTICVANYGESIVSRYNRINVLIQHFVPFLIQFLSITTLIIQTTRSRARIVNSNSENTFLTIFRKKFQMNKEYYFIPSVIVLSSLPHIIFSFNYQCTELNEGWQKYTLLTTYLLSYLPQILGFLLYVSPSQMYKEEFQKTLIGKKLIKKN